MKTRLLRIAVPGLLLGLCSLYFLVPLIATGVFSLWDGADRYNLSAYTQLFHDPGFRDSLLLSVRLAVLSVVISLILLVPTVYWIQLRGKRLRPVMEFIAVLPFVVPAIALVEGLTSLYTGPEWLVGSPNFLIVAYIILALPYTYNALDVGMRSLDIRTLSEAAQNLGANWPTLMMRAILPNLIGTLVGATLLTFAIVMGEFTFANVLLFNTFAVYINYIGQTSGTQAAALSLLSFTITWLAMLGILLTGHRSQVQLGGAR
ncbi:spermidine/putrescine transport system permease protein PotB [bacterium BMS3Bbin13]|nr:spermidine/putrescine transport system permease protein PotB [bacterium BMS3Bbin13]